MWPHPQETADLVTVTEEILNGKLHFLYSAVFLRTSLDDCFWDILGDFLRYYQLPLLKLVSLVWHSKFYLNQMPHRSSHPEIIYIKRNVLKSFSKFTGKQLWWRHFFYRSDLVLQLYLKKNLHRRCFHEIFTKLSRIAIL